MRRSTQNRCLCTSKKSYEYWPDGTRKKFQGKDRWKNYINYDSKFKQESDELNRKRHYFWRVDAKGRLLRMEIDSPDKQFGMIRDGKFLDYFFSHMQRNTSGLYLDKGFDFLSTRMHEHYFVKCDVAPIVYNTLSDGWLHHVCPDGRVARSVSQILEPEALSLSPDGVLFHTVTTKATSNTSTSSHTPSPLHACLDASVTAQLAAHFSEDPDCVGCLLEWEGTKTLIKEHDRNPNVLV